MTRLVLSLIAILFVAAPASAQTVITKPGECCAFDQPVVAGDTVLPTAYVYKLKVDGSDRGPVPVQCVAPTAPETKWLCEFDLPALTTGPHAITITASLTTAGQTYETPDAAPLSAVSIVILIPENLRPKGGGQ